MLYTIVLVSAIKQSESALHMHIISVFFHYLPIYFTTEHGVAFPGLCIQFSSVIYLICWYCLVTKSCQTLCDPMDCSLPGSYVHGISHARILEWVAISFSRVSPQPKLEPKSLTLQEILYHLSHQGSPNQFYP